jgi:3'-5' exonuclease
MQNIRPEDLIVIDIETASVSASFNLLNEKWQELWQEKTAKTLPEGISPAEFYPMRAGVMAEFSKVVCISIGYFIKEQHLKMRVKSFYGDDEEKILTDFLATITKIESFNNRWCFAGHNIKEFDIPFICRRILVNNMRIPPYLDFQNMKPWETNIVDTFQYWRFGDYKNYTSLNLLAAVMDVPTSKNDIDGSMVGALYHEKDIEQQKVNKRRIVEYCQDDVVATANIVLRFKNLPLLHPNDVEIIEQS